MARPNRRRTYTNEGDIGMNTDCILQIGFTIIASGIFIVAIFAIWFG